MTRLPRQDRPDRLQDQPKAHKAEARCLNAKAFGAYPFFEFRESRTLFFHGRVERVQSTRVNVVRQALRQREGVVVVTKTEQSLLQ